MAAKILIIEDDKIMMSSTAMVLVETGGCDVVTAMGGAEGLEVARRESPDLILLDIMMPEMDGWEVLKALKVDAGTSGIPVAIDLEGATTFTLQLVDGGGGTVQRIDFNQANWADARVTLADGQSVWLDELPVGPLPAACSTEPPFSFQYGD